MGYPLPAIPGNNMITHVLRPSSLWTFVMGRLLPAFVISTVLACGGGPTETDDNDDDGGNNEPPPGEQVLTILFTADEMANLMQSPASDGAAKLMGVWRSAEGYSHDADFVVVSGGNGWTGQTISTWFKGASVVEVMGVMGYDGKALGNLDFQFGPQALVDRAGEAAYPLLSANLRLKSNGATPGFAAAFSIKDVSGLKVGLIGLTPLNTPESNVPASTEDFDFLPYGQALSEVVPQAKAAGADLVVVVSRLCRPDLMELLPVARQLGVHVMAGGFCAETYAEVNNGVALVGPRFRFSGYGKVRVRVREKSKEILEIQAEVKTNTGGAVDEEVAVFVEKWSHMAEQELNKVVGFVNDAIPNGTPALQNLVMDSWLHAYPADIAHLNAGAIREGLPAGDIRLGAVVAAMPFPNGLVAMDLTGAQVVDCLQNGTIVAGMTTRGGHFHADGTPLKMDSTYHVLTTDFIHGSDGYKYKQYDPNPIATGIVYSEPLLIYLEALATTPENPLDPFLDPDPRR